jgi:hypothetical protein
MKNFILLGILGLAVSCSNVQHPDFAANVESAKTLLELQGSEADLQAQLDLVHEGYAMATCFSRFFSNWQRSFWRIFKRMA